MTKYKPFNKWDNITERPLVLHLYYIIDFKDPREPKALKTIYNSRDIAKERIAQFDKVEQNFYIVKQGKYIREHKLEFKRNYTKILLKYNYPLDCITPQQRKSYRNKHFHRPKSNVEKQKREKRAIRRSKGKNTK